MQVTLDNGAAVQGFVDTGALAGVSNAITGTAGDRPGVAKWLGVPYGQAERWSRISSSPNWQGVRECLEFGPIPMQPLGVPLESVWDNTPGYHLRTHVGQSEDCFTVNIFKPAGNVSSSHELLPVFVFIYGGAFRIGCSTKIRHDPTELVRQAERDGKPIIAVTFNYRVGIFGFLAHPDVADEHGINANWGLHDQLYFFRWLQRNIAKFGGDSSRITVMGNSAGAFSIGALMMRNRRANSDEMLFSNVIFESGAPCTMSFRSKDSYFPYYDALLAHAGTSADAPLKERKQALAALSTDEIMAFEGKNPPFGNYGAVQEQEQGPHAVFDTHPFDRLKRGEWDPKIQSAMVGCVTDEASLSGAPLKINTPEGHTVNIDRFPTALRSRLKELYPVNSEVESTVTAPGNRLIGHHIFHGPSYHLSQLLASVANAETGQSLPTYVFRFNTPNPHVEPSLKWGVYHTSELAYVFNMTGALWPAKSPAAKTAQEVGRRWTEFIYGGTPGADWPSFDSSKQQRAVIDDDGEVAFESMRDAPDYEQLQFWHETLSSGGPEAIRIFPLEQEWGKAGLGETVAA